MNRRTWLAGLGSSLVGSRIDAAARTLGRPNDAAPFMAQGERVGDVGPTSAMIHVRLTAEERRRSGFVYEDARPHMKPGEVRGLPSGIGVDDLEGAVPGRAGRARVVYARDPSFARSRATPWRVVGPATDFSAVFTLTGLAPDTPHWFRAESLPLEARASAATRRGPTGRFRTAPPATAFRPVTFAATTCQKYATRDTETGFLTYKSLLALAPDFLTMNGDNVYYDLEPPLATGRELAAHHWHRMYSLPSVIEAYRNLPAYWLKDDHDTLQDDCWPSMPASFMAPLTFEEGRGLFGHMVPQPRRTFRTARWGRALELWFLEGRDFRSANDATDSETKSIWGREQGDWLRRTLAGSDALFKIVVSPNPIVGPDRNNKKDNHANASFATEGRAFRRWLAERVPNAVVVTGDRHWQYHSVDPDTGIEEFGSGPVSSALAGGSPGEKPALHRFHRLAGGFLSAAVQGTAEAPLLVLRHHDPHGAVVYETRRERRSL
jgi:alkaline phosphatase D